MQNKQKVTKKDYIDDILRWCRSLTQMKYGSDEDKFYKTQIANDLAKLSEIELQSARAKEIDKANKEACKLNACV